MVHQLWCVVGARESRSHVGPQLCWGGLDDRNGVDAAGQRWLGDLLEHETQHHGQLIRYLYALDIPRPPSWRERYALD